MLFTDEITLYNAYQEDDVEKWQRTVLAGVQFKRSVEKTVTSNGHLEVAESVSITIPNRSSYLPPDEWLKDRTDHWTLNAENNLDMIVYGECAQEIIDSPKELSGAVTIKGVSDNTIRDRLKHWKVVCE